MSCGLLQLAIELHTLHIITISKFFRVNCKLAIVLDLFYIIPVVLQIVYDIFIEARYYLWRIGPHYQSNQDEQDFARHQTLQNQICNCIYHHQLN